MKDFILSKKEYLIFSIIFLFFLVIRIPAVDFPYHQDEYKWPLYAYNIGYEPGAVPHPPLSEFIYKVTGVVFNDNDFRFTPLIFSVANLFLLYLFVRRRHGVTSALWSISLFTFSFYGVLASLTVDTDGAILPFFFLLSILFYDLFYNSSGRKKILWAILLTASVVLGLLVKISFALVVVSMVIDFIIKERDKVTKEYIIKTGLIFIGFIAIFLLTIFISKFVFTGFSISRALSYWDTFIKSFFDRNFFQTGIQFVKSIFYTSPLLILIGLSSLYPYRKDFSLFHIFISLGLVFYLFAFDFSIGALDRYFAFLVVPLCIITGVIASERIKNVGVIRRLYLLMGVVIFLIVFLSQKLHQSIPSLHPKSEWIDRVLSFDWNFLYPFTGGSGPAGFYISFMFLGLSWIVGIAFFIWYMKARDELKATVFTLLLLLGVFYNGVFIMEYLFGVNNGSVPNLTARAVEFIKNNPEIDKVIVYNDIGGYDIRETGKYFRRMYAAPQFEDSYKVILESYKGYILYINIPRVESGSYYDYYMNLCEQIYRDEDVYMVAQILRCGS